MRRRLGSFESAQAFTAEFSPLNVVLVLRFEEVLGEEALLRAFEVLQQRHPMLSVRIVRQGGRYLFDSEEVGDIPLRITEDGEAEAWKGIVEDEVMGRFALGSGPLARAHLVASGHGQASDLILTFHHVIVDAASVLHLAEQLLALLGGEESLGPEPAAGTSLPPASDARFPRPYRGVARIPRVAAFLAKQSALEALRRWRGRHHPPAPADASARCLILSQDFSQEETAGLVRRCRRQRVTLNSALYAAFLQALSRRLYGGRTQYQRYFNFPDLRPYLKPPVPREVLGAYLTILPLDIEVAADGDLWSLATTLNQRFLEAARRGEKFLSCLASPTLMRLSLRRGAPRMGAAALSYCGVADIPSGALRLRDLRSFVSNFHIGPEFTAQSRLFGRRLCWDYLYLDTDMDVSSAQAIAGEIRSILVA